MSGLNRIAVLFFSRTPSAEAKSKAWFGPRNGRNIQLSNFLFSQASRAIDGSGLEVFHFNEHNQRGVSFGERFSNAFQDIFDQGYQAVVAIGGDSPEITSLDWPLIREGLLNGQSFIGPTSRGGAYLVALQKKGFHKDRFAGLAWQTPDTLGQLLEYCKHTELVLLNPLWDINCLNDLWQTIQDKAVKQIIRVQLERILCQPAPRIPLLYQVPAKEIGSKGIVAGRAPPTLA